MLLAQALAMRGEALGLLGDLPLGRAQVERALDLARDQEDHLAEVEALRILANLESAALDFGAAERLAQEALAMATALAHPWATATVQRDLGELFARGGRGHEAVAAFTAAAEVYRRLGAVSRADRMHDRGIAITRH